MAGHGIFHADFKVKPFWWEAFAPQTLDDVDLPKDVTVAIIGAGYAGLSAALELNKQGIDCVVVEAEQPGIGASTRSGGLISPGDKVGRRYTKIRVSEQPQLDKMRAHGFSGFELVKNLIEEENIQCHWTQSGRFVGAWCNNHFEAMKQNVDLLNLNPENHAYMVPRDRQTEEIGSTYYRGGYVTERAGHLHPSLYFKGLLDACHRRQIPICANAPVQKLNKLDAGWNVETTRGTIKARDVIIATNGYTGDATPQFKRRLVPMCSYIIATEELPEDVARSLSPKNRAFGDTRRVLSYFRLSPDGKRMIYGGRAKFGLTDAGEIAPTMYQFMLDRFPQLKGFKITHAWTGNVAFTLDEVPHMGNMDGLHYALGCNGSGVIMMTYMGTQVARKIAGVADYDCGFDGNVFPSSPLYNGNPWFVPTIGRYFKVRDWLDRRFM